jgi:molecular chaperone GrpE
MEENINTSADSSDEKNADAEICCEPEVQADELEVDEVTALKLELEKQKEESQKNHDQYLRALAEVDNIRKRTQREREEYIKYASLPVFKKLLPVIDDLERAINMSANSNDFEGLYKGVTMITGKLQELIQGEGVKPIDCLDKPFDPQMHQPLMVEANDAYEKNIVMEELQKGYTMQGRVIRPSLVKVSE